LLDKYKEKSMIDIINDYELLQKNFGKLLDRSGYRLDYLAKEIGMTREYFYVKKQRGTFNHDQMKKLLNIIWKPEMEDVLFGEILKKYDKGDYATQDEIKAAFA
jgi:hypothetical protein